MNHENDDNDDDDEMSAITMQAFFSDVKAIESRSVATEDDPTLNVNNMVLSSLVDMGFERTKCRLALHHAQNDLDLAINMMLSKNK